MRKLVTGLCAALLVSASVPAFAQTGTTNYGWLKPTIGASANSWGSNLNNDLDGIDSTVFGIQGTANAACPKAGCTLTGGLTGTTAAFAGASTFGSTLGVTGLLSASGGVAVTGTVSATGVATLSTGTAGGGSDYLILKPTDFAAGKPEIYFHKDSASNLQWDLNSFDGANPSTATLNINLASVAFGGTLSSAGLITAGNGISISGSGALIAGGLTLSSGTLTLPAASVANSALDTVNSSSGPCGSATTTCTFTTNAQGRITVQGSAATHAAMSASTAGALETNDGTNVKWATRASGYFSSCSNTGCTLAAGNGVISVTRQALGNYFVNFGVNFPNTNFTVICTAGSSGAGSSNIICTDNTLNNGRSVAGVDVVISTGGNNPIDPAGGFNILVIQN